MDTKKFDPSGARTPDLNLDPESEALTTRPPRSPKLNWVECLWGWGGGVSLAYSDGSTSILIPSSRYGNILNWLPVQFCTTILHIHVMTN